MLKYDNSEAEKSVINVIGTFTLKDDGDKTIGHTITSAVTNEEVIVYGGVITGGCPSDNGGGGVFVSGGTFTMLGGAICGNKSNGSGGGVFVYDSGIFNLFGGTISENYTTDGHFGGGVCLAGGTFNMYGGVICKNEGILGGGVDIYEGTFNLSGGAISENISYSGGGVYVDDGTFNVSGAPNITGNTDTDGDINNVYLNSGKTITVVGELIAGAQIGVYNNSVVITSGYGDNNMDENSNIIAPSCFIADSEGYVPILDGGEVKLAVGVVAVTFDGNGTVYSNIVDAWDYANGLATTANKPAQVVMFADITITDKLVVNSGKYITLDLNGHILKFTLLFEGAANRCVVEVSGNFTLVDSNTQAEHSYYVRGDKLWVFVGDDYEDDGIQTLKIFRGGVITGGLGTTLPQDSYNASGGGVFVANGGTFIMKGGAIAGNTTDYGGGVGIYDGTFIMENGIICGNKDVLDGGGVSVRGREGKGSFTLKNGTISNNIGSGVVVTLEGSEFNMTGGVICDNTVNGKGGGVSVSGGAVFNMSDGTICNNTASGNGGGVMVGGGGIFNISGTPIIMGNYGANGSNDNACVNYSWYESEKTKITVSGNLDSGAQIGVHVISMYWVEFITGFTQDDDPSAYFIPDDSDYDCLYVIDEDGTVCIAMHNFYGEETVISDPSCTEVGEKIVACLNDSSHTTTAIIPAIGHSWAEELSHDETYHWYDCVNDCGETQNKQPHTFANGVCACGYVQPVDVAQVMFNGTPTVYVTVEAAFAYANSLETTEKAPAVITLLDDATTTDTLTVEEGKYITLDLNGCMLKYDNDSVKNSVITVNGTFTLKDSNTDTTNKREITDHSGETVEVTGGVITGGTGTEEWHDAIDYYYGGGVYVDGGTFVMNGGNISGNFSGGDGGGVYVDGGTFIMNDGNISYNFAFFDGGGVAVYNMYNDEGAVIAEGAFTMNGGTIGYNIAGEEGGGVSTVGSFTMNGGTITYNRTQDDEKGGGVFVDDGTFIMTDGTISYNYSDEDGGGVAVYDGTFKMSGGVICNNSAYEDGGGVYVSVIFEMTGGVIRDNTAEDYGNGVYVSMSGTFKMSGGTISDHIEGFGVWVSENATFEVSGAPNITGNKNSENNPANVYLEEGQTITVAGALTDGAVIGVYLNGVIATGFKQDGKPSDYFIPDNPAYNCVYVSDEDTGTVTIGEHDYASDWTADENSHWHACVHCGAKSDEADHVAGDEATCTTAQVCTACDYQMVGALDHDFTGEYLSDDDGHWHVCRREGCEVTDTKQNHVAVTDNAVAPTCTESGLTAGSHCSACGKVLEAQATVAALGHTLNYNPAAPATNDKEGNIEFWDCEDCNKFFADEDGKTEITDKSSVIIPKTAPVADGGLSGTDILWITLIVVLSAAILIEVAIIVYRAKRKAKAKAKENK